MNNDIVKQAAALITGGSTFTQQEREEMARAILALVPVRDIAVSVVDAVHGYTCEFSHDPAYHASQYDTAEAVITDILRNNEMNKISQEEIATLFPDGLPMELAKVMFPELSKPLTPDEIRFLMRSVATTDRQYNIGPQTMERVFEAAGLTDLSDLQAVMDAVERALTSQVEVPPAPSVAVKHEELVKRLLDIGSMNDDQHTARTAYDAVTALSAQVQDVIKPLEWDRYNGNSKWIFGTFDIQQDSDGSWMLFQFFTDENEDLKITYHPTREAAEQAAQTLHNAEVAKYLQG